VGLVDRVDLPKSAGPDVKVDQLIGKGMFKRDTDISSFLGLKVHIQVRKAEGAAKPTENESSTKGEEKDDEFVEEATGYIDSSFGKTGKFKVTFRGQLSAARPNDRVVLRFKKYVIGGSAGKKELVQ